MLVDGNQLLVGTVDANVVAPSFVTGFQPLFMCLKFVLLFYLQSFRLIAY